MQAGAALLLPFLLPILGSASHSWTATGSRFLAPQTFKQNENEHLSGAGVDPSDDGKFVPTALADSLGDFVNISVQQAHSVAALVKHPRTFGGMYRRGPASRLQNIAEPRILRQVFFRALITWSTFLALSLLVVRYRLLDYIEEAHPGKGAEPGKLLQDIPNVRQQWKIVLLSFTCPGVLWAEITDRSGVMSFWLAFCVMSIIWFVKWFTFWICTWFMLLDLTGCLILYHRRRVRRKLHQPGGCGASWGYDCLLSFLFAPTVIVQDANAVSSSRFGKEP